MRSRNLLNLPISRTILYRARHLCDNLSLSMRTGIIDNRAISTERVLTWPIPFAF
jgi:hypothetical protein